MPKSLEYGISSILPETEQLLTENGTVQRFTEALGAVLQCAMCPLANEKYYSTRIEKCSEMDISSAIRIKNKLIKAKVFIPSKKKIPDSRGHVRELTVFDVAPKVKDSVPNPKPLPGCMMKS